MTSDNKITGTWRKSSRSGGAQQCVEVACTSAERRAVRDSKSPTGQLAFTDAAWTAFLGRVTR